MKQTKLINILLENILILVHYSSLEWKIWNSRRVLILFRGNPANYVMKIFNNPGDILNVVRDMEDPMKILLNKYITKDLIEGQ